VSEGRRFSATGLVGVPLTTGEVRPLLDAPAEGKLGAVDEPHLQVAAATERRLGSSS
jgi:hypothetical protein